MESFLSKAGEYLIAQGPIGLLCAWLAYDKWRGDKRNDSLTLELKELAKDAYGVLAVIKDKIK